jgi:hypothetical protein
MSKIYLIVPFENKDDAKNLGVKFDWDKKLWYANNTNKNKLLEKYKEYKSFDKLIGENREFNGSNLFIDLIPTTSWFNNVRSCIYNEDWLRIRKYIYERVNYKCECCGLYCKNRIEYDDEDLDKNSDDEDSDEEINDYLLELKSNNEFNKNEELKKWNTIQLEAHERWSYDDINNIQKLERIIALCHRCHSVTHSGLTGLRGLSNQANKHLMKVNNWNEEQVLNHHKEQKNIWMERNKIKWNIDLSIITNSGIKLKEKEQLKKENIKLKRETEREENKTIRKLNIIKTDNYDDKNKKKKHIMNIVKSYTTNLQTENNDGNFISFHTYLEKNIIQLKEKYPNINSFELAKICSDEYKKEQKEQYPDKSKFEIASLAYNEYTERKLNNIGSLFD